MKLIGLLIFCIFTLANSGCVEPSGSGNRSAPYSPTDGWRTSTPEQQGIDSEKLAETLDYIHEKDVNIHSLLIIRNGYVVTDAYFYPFAKGSVHDVASVTKSFTATLIGIAISEGHIKGVEQPVLEFFPERTIANVDAKKKAMTLEDLLTMRSGFECIEEPSEVTLNQMQASPDWIQFTLDLPMAEEPGTHFVYCGSNSHLLSGIIKKTTGINELAYANKSLFEPLGITNIIWPTDPQGNNHGMGNLHLTPYDMAKLGYLYLNKGIWNEKQIVPAEWVEKSTQKQVSLDKGEGYGYQWWVSGSIPGLYEANGRGGQRISVLPEKNIIVVTTGGGFEPGELAPFLLEAIKSDKPLPENPEAYGRLQDKIDRATEPPDIEPEPVQPLPEMARKIGGKKYVLDPNPLNLQSISLTFDEKKAEALLSIGLEGNQNLEYLLGLDNISRTSPGRFGLPAMGKGSWESNNSFVIYLDEIGNINHWKIKATFKDDQVTIQMQETVTDIIGRAEFEGRLENSSGQKVASRNISAA